MLRELWKEHTFMSCIMLLGTASLVLQAVMALSLKGYVKASANMKTTRKKVMLNLKSQFEAIYGMDYQVRNISAYVDKYLLKLRFLGFSYSAWEKVPFLTAGLLMLFAGIGIFYGYVTHAGSRMQIEILFSCGVMLVCLFVFYHIFGIKSKKEQIQIQLADYLENYLTNRLIRNRESGRQLKLMDENMEQAVLTGTEGSFDEILKQAQKAGNASDIEEDMEMLKRLLREMDAERQERERRAAERRRRAEAESAQGKAAENAEAEFAAGAEERELAGSETVGMDERDLADPEITGREEGSFFDTGSCETADACDEAGLQETDRMEEESSFGTESRETADACDEAGLQETDQMEEESSSGTEPRETADACDEGRPQETARMEEESSSGTEPRETADTCDEDRPQETTRMEGGSSSGEAEGLHREEYYDDPEVISFEEAAAKKGSRSGSTGIRQAEQTAVKGGTGPDAGQAEQTVAKGGAEAGAVQAEQTIGQGGAEAGAAQREQTIGKSGMGTGGDADQSASEMAAAREDAIADASLPSEAEIELLEEFVMSFLAQAGGAS